MLGFCMPRKITDRLAADKAYVFSVYEILSLQASKSTKFVTTSAASNTSGTYATQAIPETITSMTTDVHLRKFDGTENALLWLSNLECWTSYHNKLYFMQSLAIWKDQQPHGSYALLTQRNNLNKHLCRNSNHNSRLNGTFHS